MRRDPLIVLKFGSSVLRRSSDLPAVVHEVYRWRREGYHVLAVVSALGGTTDRLLTRARRFGDEPDEEATASLVATGEATAAALLGLALDRAGVPARVLDADRIGLRAEGPVDDANLCGLDERKVLSTLDACPVAAVSGSVGRSADGRVSLLGRGGSDLTALFLAQRLRADRCRLIKDVDGLYERDPNAGGPRPRRYRTLRWDDALAQGGGVVQQKALHFAQAHGLSFEVAALGTPDATHLGSGPTAPYPARPAPRPLRVSLLGLGTVGLGVYRELIARPDFFEVRSVAVRRRRPLPGPAGRVTDDPWQVLADKPDVLVEVMGGRQPAGELITRALAQGIDVVTANKTVLAEFGARLHRLAERADACLLHAAAVGGAVPMLETVQRLARYGSLCRLEGVLNGTSNLVLDRLAAGTSLDAAIRRAQAHGFAEADPTLDLDGTDVAQKLLLLARAGFGADATLHLIECRGIDSLDPAVVRRAAASGQVLRLVGSVQATAQGLVGCVAPRILLDNHPLARLRREQNGLIVTPAEGEPVFVWGKGAGRWPTTEAVMADLMTLVRRRRDSTHAAAGAPTPVRNDTYEEDPHAQGLPSATLTLRSHSLNHPRRRQSCDSRPS